MSKNRRINRSHQSPENDFIQGQRPGAYTHGDDVFEPYSEIYSDYYVIYRDYLTNLLINEFKYENAPVTFNARGLEFMLRYYGWANIVAKSKDNITVSGVKDGTNGVNFIFGTLYGDCDDNSVVSQVNDKGEKYTHLTKLNTKDSKPPYILTISNKMNYYLSFNVSDVLLINRTASTLAEIKATTITNIRQQKTPFIGFSKNGNLTSKSVWEQLQSGKPYITVDSDMTDYDIRKIIQIMPVQTPNLAPTLKDSWNDTISEFLNMIGLDSMAVDKKERLVASEADSNDQQVSISASIYLDARNEQLALINDVFGTKIRAKLNFDTLADNIELLRKEGPKDDVSVSETGDDTEDK